MSSDDRRSVGLVLAGGLVTLAVCSIVALLGRAWDWSPFALVVAGAIAGWLVAFGSIMAAWQIED